MKKELAVVLDIGGTFIKSALVTPEGSIRRGSMLRTPVDSSARAERIITAFTEVIAAQKHRAESARYALAGLGIGMPGPFDYARGISRIRGVGKYEALYGINLGDEFRKRLSLDNSFHIVFENDAWCFVFGEAWRGAGRGYRRIIGITLGTGCGSGFVADNAMVDRGPGVPPMGWIAGAKFGDGILDDRLSRRGIIGRYRELGGETGGDIDVAAIAERARGGDPTALAVFEETGAILGNTLRPHVADFEAECVIVGGGIAKSFALFEAPLQNALPAAVTLRVASNISESALVGAGRFLYNHIKEEK